LATPQQATRGRRKNWLPQIPFGRSRSIGCGAAFQPPEGAKYHSFRDRPRHTLLYARDEGPFRAGAVRRPASGQLRPPAFHGKTAPTSVHGSEP